MNLNTSDAPPAYTATDEITMETNSGGNQNQNQNIEPTEPVPKFGWKEALQGVQNTFTLLSHWSIARENELTIPESLVQPNVQTSNNNTSEKAGNGKK